jgi:TPR repeat protein
MNEVTSDQDIDQLVWSVIKDSQNPNDFISFIRHARDRDVDYESAYNSALQYRNNLDAPSLFPNAVAKLEDLASAGCSSAMLHLGIWHRLGVGVPINSEKGLAWYKAGMELMDGRCFMGYAIGIVQSDPDTSRLLFQRAVELGCGVAHSYWADVDKANYMEHMALGAKSNDPIGVYIYSYELLRRASKDHEIEHALDVMKRASKLGSTNASFQLAMMFIHGEHGKRVDTAAAEYWFKKGIRSGSVNCISALGIHLLRSVPDRLEEGLNLLLKGAVCGDPQAQYFLGQHLMRKGKSADERAEGLRWLETAAEQEYTTVYYLLAFNYKNGLGVEPDLEISAKWAKKGVDIGDADCQCFYGLALIYGEGVEKDLEKAHNLFHAAHIQNNNWGTYLLGMSYERGDGVEVDKEKALECYKIGANKGDINCTFMMGVAYLFGELAEADYPMALKWLKISADKGSSKAKTYIGLMFINGSGVQADTESGIKWLEEAASEGCAHAMRELGNLYFNGEKVPLDLDLAKRWMGKAAANGDEVAIQWIKTNCPEKPDWLNNLIQSSPSEKDEL